MLKHISCPPLLFYFRPVSLGFAAWCKTIWPRKQITIISIQRENRWDYTIFDTCLSFNSIKLDIMFYNLTIVSTYYFNVILFCHFLFCCLQKFYLPSALKQGVEDTCNSLVYLLVIKMDHSWTYLRNVYQSWNRSGGYSLFLCV